MPGGTAAGTVLVLNFFLILINRAGSPASNISIGEKITQPMKKRKPIRKKKVKWVDDMTLCNAVNLKEALVPEDRVRPERGLITGARSTACPDKPI